MYPGRRPPVDLVDLSPEESVLRDHRIAAAEQGRDRAERTAKLVEEFELTLAAYYKTVIDRFPGGTNRIVLTFCDERDSEKSGQEVHAGTVFASGTFQSPNNIAMIINNDGYTLLMDGGAGGVLIGEESDGSKIFYLSLNTSDLKIPGNTLPGNREPSPWQPYNAATFGANNEPADIERLTARVKTATTELNLRKP